ncbi:hypothetical protein Taro_007037, partial [Colocasia esculenta]|nr:hypothetical protein [Colocasia esculenta]
STVNRLHHAQETATPASASSALPQLSRPPPPQHRAQPPSHCNPELAAIALLQRTARTNPVPQHASCMPGLHLSCSARALLAQQIRHAQLLQPHRGPLAPAPGSDQAPYAPAAPNRTAQLGWPSRSKPWLHPAPAAHGPHMLQHFAPFLLRTGASPGRYLLLSICLAQPRAQHPQISSTPGRFRLASPSHAQQRRSSPPSGHPAAAPWPWLHGHLLLITHPHLAAAQLTICTASTPAASGAPSPEVFQQLLLENKNFNRIRWGYNWLVDHVGIHGQGRLTEALNKDSLVR